jgi:adenylate cyclase
MTNTIPGKSVKKAYSPLIAGTMTLAFLLLAVFRLDLTDPDFLTRIDFLWMDAKFRMRGYEQPGDQVVLVAIDEKTLQRLGSARVFQRHHFATLLDRLSEGHPKVIGFDMTFSEADVSSAENDARFAAAIARAGNVVLGVYLQLQSNTADRSEATPMTAELEQLVAEKQVFPAEHRGAGDSGKLDAMIQGKALRLALPEFMRAARSFGFVNFHRDYEGGLRYQPQFISYQGRLYPSLDVQLVKLFLDAPSTMLDIESEHSARMTIGDRLIPTDPFGRYMLNFDGPAGWHRTVSMIDIIDGLIPPGVFQGKIVLIGWPAVGLSDVVTSPFAAALPAMELHASVLDNFLRQNFLHRPQAAKIADLALIIVFGLITGLYLPRLNARRSVLFALALLALFAAINIVSFIRFALVLSFVYPGLMLLATAGSVISYKYLTEERERKQTKEAFKYYLDPVVVEQVMDQPELLRLGGDKREMSVLFSDVRGFTSFSEKMAPTEVVYFLNQYFEKMQGLIFKNKGTLDKLIGDAVMCFWGAPLPAQDHALRAVVTALEMSYAVDDLRSVLILPGGGRFEIGIGVNTGPMVVGNMGSQLRMSYTVMGDNVNLGARLEALNKFYGTRILISDATYEACRHMVVCRELDTIQVKGKARSVTIYEPIGLRRQSFERRRTDRRGPDDAMKKIKRSFIVARYGDRRREDRRVGSDRLAVQPEQEEVAAMYEHALALYRKGDLDAADMAFDHVMSLKPNDGPSKLMKGRISRYRREYADTAPPFDPVFRFDEK